MIEDRLDDAAPAPAPQPAPRPAPAPAPQPQPPVNVDPPPAPAPKPSLLATLVVLALLGNLGYWAWTRNHDVGPTPTPVPAADLKAKGRDYGKHLALFFGQSIKQAAADIRAGERPMTKIKDEEHPARWGAQRAAYFDTLFVDALDGIVRPGDVKPTAEDRARYADALDKIGDGSIEASK